MPAHEVPSAAPVSLAEGASGVGGDHPTAAPRMALPGGWRRCYPPPEAEAPGGAESERQLVRHLEAAVGPLVGSPAIKVSTIRGTRTCLGDDCELAFDIRELHRRYAEATAQAPIT